MEKRSDKKLIVTPSKDTSSKDFIFGIHPVMEAINSGKEFDKLMIQRGGQSEQLKTLFKAARDHNIPFSMVPTERLNRITRKNHQGVIGYISAISFASIDFIVDNLYAEGKSPFILILDRITDVRNFGAIIRSAECAGVHAVVIPSRGNAQIGHDAMKTSAGALNHLPVCREDNLKDTIVYLKNSGLKIVACTEKTDSNIYTTDFTGPTAIIMGSEGEGISPEYIKMADTKAAIPLQGQIDSLNVSVACGIVLYEALRQRITKQ